MLPKAILKATADCVAFWYKQLLSIISLPDQICHACHAIPSPLSLKSSILIFILILVLIIKCTYPHE